MRLPFAAWLTLVLSVFVVDIVAKHYFVFFSMLLMTDQIQKQPPLILAALYAHPGLAYLPSLLLLPFVRFPLSWSNLARAMVILFATVLILLFSLFAFSAPVWDPMNLFRPSLSDYSHIISKPRSR